MVGLRDSQGSGSEESRGPDLAKICYQDCYQVVRFIVQLGKLRPREPEVDIALWSRVVAPFPTSPRVVEGGVGP